MTSPGTFYSDGLHLYDKNWNLTPVHKFHERLVFGHIVNHREPKGTRFVLDAVHKARMSGADFGFIFAERLPHSIALNLYKHIDVLLEQFVIGWYGLQACEFALMGKPSVVYIRTSDGPPLIPDDLWRDIPFIRSTGDTLHETIIDICNMSHDILYDIGKRSIAFVEKYHSHIAATQQVIHDLLVPPKPDNISREDYEEAIHEHLPSEP